MQDIITDKRIEKIGLVIGTIFFAVALIKPTFTLKVANQVWLWVSERWEERERRGGGEEGILHGLNVTDRKKKKYLH
jgi:hypothetical protein